MKDKNLIIALAISAAVILGWSFFFSPSKNEPDEAIVPDSEEVAESAEETTEDTLTDKGSSEEISTETDVAESDKPTTNDEGDTVIAADEDAGKGEDSENKIEVESVFATVETPLYTAIFRDAGLESFKISKYPSDEDSLMFERLDTRDYLPFQVVGDFPDGAVWSVDKESLDLSGSETGELTWTLSDGDDVYATTKIAFDGETYGMGVEMDVANEDELTIAVGGYTKGEDDPKRDTDSISVHGRLAGKGKRDQLKSKENKTYTGSVEWVCLRSKYYIIAMLPMEGETFAGWEVKRSKKDFIEGYVTIDNPKGETIVFDSYIGPKYFDGLKAVRKGLESTVDLGWTFIGIIGAIILRFLNWINGYIHNYGLSIIILTALIKAITWPLSAASIKSTKKMGDIQPILKQAQEKYKGDPQRLNAETMDIYKRYKINPFSGCLPLLVQMPIFYALFTTLRNAIEMKNAPFMLWINDLSQPDALFNLPFTIPLIGAEVFSVLPIIMLAAMLTQSLMSQTKGAVKSQQQKMMAFMPLIFGVLFYTMPSGLVLYWSVSTILTIVQQFLMLNLGKKEVPAK